MRGGPQLGRLLPIGAANARYIEIAESKAGK
jgi:hypothetical protein